MIVKCQVSECGYNNEGFCNRMLVMSLNNHGMCEWMYYPSGNIKPNYQ